MHVVGEQSFDSYVSKVTASLTSIESELLRKSEVLQKPRNMLLDTKAARDRHLQEIGARKRCVVDAVETIYQEIEFSTKNAYDELEAEGQATAAVAERIDADLSHARDYIRRLLDSNEKCEILNQQKIVRERMSALSAELDRLSDRLMTTTSEVKIEASLPDDVEDVVRAWIGTPRVYAESSAADPLQLIGHQEHAAAATQQLLLPERLSLCDYRAAVEQQQQQVQSSSGSSSRRQLLLAVLCYDSANRDRAVLRLSDL